MFNEYAILGLDSEAPKKGLNNMISLFPNSDKLGVLHG